MRVVGVIVGVEHAVEPIDIDVEQLLAEVGRSVDQHIGGPLAALPLHQHRAAAAAVLGVRRIARAPMIADTWHAARRAAAENGELQCHAVDWPRNRDAGTFLNRRAKLAVVAAAISASLKPRTAARRAAVWATLAGSLVRPRNGSGAR